MKNVKFLQLALLINSLASSVVFGQSTQTCAPKTLSSNPIELKQVQSIKVPGLRSGSLSNIFGFSEDGKLLATQEWNDANKSSLVKVRDLQTGKVERVWVVKGLGLLALSPDGKTVAISIQLPTIQSNGFFLQQIELRDVHSGKTLIKLPTQEPEPKTLIFSPDSKIIVTDNSVWEVKSGTLLWIITPRYVWPKFAFSPDGKFLATSEYAYFSYAQGKVQLWNVHTGKVVKLFEGSGGADGPILFSKDGNYLVTSGKPPQWVPPQDTDENGNSLYGASGYPIEFAAKLWDVQSGKCLRIMQGTSRHHIPIGFLSDDKKIVVEEEDLVKIWSVKEPKLVATWQKPDGALYLNQGKNSVLKNKIIAITNSSIDIYKIPESALQP